MEVEIEKNVVIANWNKFTSDIEEIKMLFDKLIENYQLKEDSIDTVWYKGKFSICINLPKLRGDC